jgi:hypothetical protein
VLISSNRPLQGWDEVLSDQVVAATIMERLLHHSHVLTIRGNSYRLSRPEWTNWRGHTGTAASTKTTTKTMSKHRHHSRRSQGGTTQKNAPDRLSGG